MLYCLVRQSSLCKVGSERFRVPELKAVIKIHTQITVRSIAVALRCWVLKSVHLLGKVLLTYFDSDSNGFIHP